MIVSYHWWSIEFFWCNQESAKMQKSGKKSLFEKHGMISICIECRASETSYEKVLTMVNGQLVHWVLVNYSVSARAHTHTHTFLTGVPLTLFRNVCCFDRFGRSIGRWHQWSRPIGIHKCIRRTSSYRRRPTV